MPDLNKVMLAGRLTRDAELKYVSTGTAVTKMGIAVSRKFKTKTGEMREETLFVNVTIWGASAEYCGEYLKKGMPVIVEGRLTSSEWEDKQTGQRRTAIEVTAERVQQIAWDDKRRGPDQGGNRQGGQQQDRQGGQNYGNQSNDQNTNQQGGGSYEEYADNQGRSNEPIPEDDIPF
jgi:single-strand DNA-binding protein